VAQSIRDLVASLGFHSYHTLVDIDRNNGLPDLLSYELGIVTKQGVELVGWALVAIGLRSAAAWAQEARLTHECRPKETGSPA
jgi:hypothetical protein